MFPRAFPLPAETRGDNPASGTPQFRAVLAADQCEYDTAIFAAFQLELGKGPAAGLTPPAAKCRLSTTLQTPEES
jgi:hypothetical protein